MNETTELEDLIPDSEKPQNIPPFQIGDLVMMRSNALKLAKFWRFPKNDVGIVLELKKSLTGDDWFVNIHWQKFVPKNGKSVIKHTRLKKIRLKKYVP